MLKRTKPSRSKPPLHSPQLHRSVYSLMSTSTNSEGAAFRLVVTEQSRSNKSSSRESTSFPSMFSLPHIANNQNPCLPRDQPEDESISCANIKGFSSKAVPFVSFHLFKKPKIEITPKICTCWRSVKYLRKAAK